MIESNAGKALIALRMAVGLGAWAVPETSARSFGLDPDGNPQASYIGRLFGARDVALALGPLAASAEDRRLWWRLGVVCDLADVAAGALAGRRGTLPSGSAALVTATALAAAALGVAALAGEPDSVVDPGEA